MTVFAAPRERPRVTAVTDGINVTSGLRSESRPVKVTAENVGEPGDYVFAFHLNKRVQSRVRAVTVWKNGEKLTSIDVEVV